MSNTSEYSSLLQDIQKQGFISPIDPPEDEIIYNINLNDRTVETPEFIGTTKEHLAEFVYFCVDRFYDQMDLFETTCVIQYVNAKGEGRMYKVPFYNITYMGSEKIVFPWVVGYDVTKQTGIVSFSVQFYQTKNDRVIFSVQTKPAKTQVYSTLNNEKAEENRYEPTKLQEILDQIVNLQKEYQLFWYDLN